MSVTSEVNADSPLFYGRMGEPSGTTCVDASGLSHDLTYSGSPTLAVASLLVGDADTCVTFDGTDDRASIGWASWQNAANISCEAWVKTTATGIRSILDRDSPTANRRTFQFRLNAGKVEFVRIVNAAGTTSIVTATSVSTVNNGSARHVAATYDGSNIRIYVDGVLESTTAASGGINQPSGSTEFSVGVNRSTVGGSQWYSGQLDEVAYYGTALSGARIAAHFYAGVRLSALVHHAAAGHNGSAVASVTTISFVPQANSRLYVYGMAVGNFNNAADVTLTGNTGGLTFNRIEQSGSGTPDHRMALFEAIVGGSPSAMTVTLDGFTGAVTGWIAYGVFSVSGTNPQVKSAQLVDNTGSGATCTTGTLPSAPTNGNFCVICAGSNTDNNAAIGTASGWVSVAEAHLNIAGVRTMAKADFTGTSTTYANESSNGYWDALLVEFEDIVATEYEGWGVSV